MKNIRPELTPRERECLDLIAEGLRPREVAERLFLDIRTIQDHLTNAYRKLKVHTAIGAVNRAVELDLIVCPCRRIRRS